jgi:hypothetical protein
VRASLRSQQQGETLNETNKDARHHARLSDEQSLIKARYCQSILNVAAIRADQEARALMEGLTTE